MPGVSDCDQHGVSGVVVDGINGLAHVLECRQLLVGRQVAVADVVDPAGEGVDSRKGPALGRPEQTNPVGEILRLPPGDGLAQLVGGLDVGRSDP